MSETAAAEAVEPVAAAMVAAAPVEVVVVEVVAAEAAVVVDRPAEKGIAGVGTG